MIIRLCEDTPKLALKIVQPGCDGKQLMDLGVEIQISAAHCHIPQDRVVVDICLNIIDVVRPQIPTLVYPAFELDDDGRIVFYFDKRLWVQPPGRYHARVLIGGYCDKTHIDIDLCNRPIIIEQVAVISATGCGDNQC